MTTVIRPEWPVGPKGDGPEDYAPPRQRALKALDYADHIAKQQGDEANPSLEKLEAFIAQNLGASLDEIDRAVSQLESIREFLRNEGERVGRIVADYVSLSKESMAAMKVISDNLKRWRDSQDESEHNS
jgi:ABC-type transporter Mla subunit MlaD